MSSNGLWKVTSQPPSIVGQYALSLSTGNSPRCSPLASQDEPIDFSQKSEPTTPSDNLFANDGEVRKKFKTETGTDLQKTRNGYPFENTGYAAIDQYYNVRDKEPFARQQIGMLNGVEKNGHEGLEQIHPQNGNSSPKEENGDPSVYLGAVRSPSSCPRTDVTSSRASPRSPEGDIHRASFSSLSSPETEAYMTNGRGQQIRSPGANVNSMDVSNGGGVSPLHMNGHLPNFMVPSTSSNVAHSTGDSVSFSAAGMMNGRRLSKLPHLTIPIMNPMNVRKMNGSSPRTSTPTAALPYLSPPIPYEDPRVLQMPNPWPVITPFAPSILQAQLEDKKSNKHIRPFKAYSNDIINTFHPGLNVASAGLGSAANFEHFLKLQSNYLDHMSKSVLLKEPETKKETISEQPSTSDMTKYDCQSTTTTTNGCGETLSSSEMKGNDSNSSLSPRNDESQQQSSDNGTGRKRGHRYPENEKDPAYWERRKKNNEAAKRSRDARRRKEDALAMTAKELMEERIKMTMHMSFQMNEIKKLEEENQFLKERELTLKNYVYHLENRCRDCSLCSNLNPDKRPV